MDVDATSKYAVLLRNTRVCLYQSPEIQIKADEIDGNLEYEKQNDTMQVTAGALVQIFQSKNYTSSSKNLIVIQILDYANRMAIYENLYECPQAHLRRVNERIWPFVISIVDPEQRLLMIQNTNHCKWLQQLKVYDLVSVAGEMFNNPSANYDCKIRYIGPVEDIYPVGYFFGLEILDLNSGCSPQADKIPFSQHYMSVDSHSAIITTSNWISEITKEQKFSARGLINDTIEKVKSAIGPSSSVTGSAASNTSSLKKDKKAKKTKGPTSQFYGFGYSIDNSLDNNISNNDRMERSKILNNLSHDCDELKQSIINREKSLERRGLTTSTAQTQTQPQSGILKKQSKPSAALSESGPEIVVIANQYIDDSLRQESDVIVVEKSQDVDLAELLGDQWPANAGEAAVILNKQTTGINANSNSLSNNKTNRNKSSNSLTHLAGNNAKKSNDITASNNKNSDNNKKSQKPHNNNPIKELDVAKQSLIANVGKSYRKIDIDAALEALDFLPAVLDSDFMQHSSMQEVPNTDLGLGSMVEVNVPDSSGHLSGVIRWIGIPPGENNILIGVELDDDCIDKQLVTTDGGFNGVSLFKCPAGRGIFVTSDQCSIDRRFLGAVGNGSCENENKLKTTNGFHDDQQLFGHMDCPAVPGAIAPLKCPSLTGLEELCGKFKGIQGHHNSCYLDVTLFAMFTFTPVFDTILYRPPGKDDISEYAEVQTVLREEIVNPLRKHMFVRADRVLKLRKLLDKLSSVSGLCSEEKDPEEFLSCLLSQIMRAEPYLKLNSGHDGYYYQLFVEKDERLTFPSVQQLFEQSFYASDIKLKEVPSCLIIQMPRFGKSFKVYPRILPSQVLDVTDIIDDSPRQCSVCGKLAEYECRDCFGNFQSGAGLESTSFCSGCIGSVHRHAKRQKHSYRELSVPEDFRVLNENMTVPRVYMELFAVVCIETSHYVTFVKAGSGPDAPWCFFDSMADRKGEKNGYNIPEMITVPDLPQWLSEDGAHTVNQTSSNDKMLPEHAKRLFCDAYMCMYQSTDVMMYR